MPSPAVPENGRADDDHRTALVTGGSRGIGAEIVRTLASRGCNVGCGYRHGKSQVRKLQDEIGPRLHPVPYSLGSAISATRAVEVVLDRWGRLDALVLNAGEWRGGRIDELATDDWWHVLEINVAGMAQLTRAALPALRASAQGSVLLVSSVVGLSGHAGDTAYASAKAAMVGFARSLAKEVGRDGIRVNVLAPGFVETDMTEGVAPAVRRRIERRSVLGRFGKPVEIARTAAFLLEDATFCTGVVLVADGGWSL
jgi:3-oxoacyl-[acyl-carrier protein] reductase